MAFRISNGPFAALVSCAAAAVLVTGAGLADHDDPDSPPASLWQRAPGGEVGTGLRIDCDLGQSEPMVPPEPVRIVFEPVGVVRLPPGNERHGPWSIGTVYTERSGRREERLDEMAEWFPPDKLRCELRFGGRFEARFRAVFECGRDKGSLFEESRLVATLEKCRSVAVPGLPYHLPVGLP